MKWYYWLGILIAIALGIVTLVPTSASKPNLLGYEAHCTFSPISAVICWVIAGIVYWFGKDR